MLAAYQSELVPRVANQLHRRTLRVARRRVGSYLLRASITDTDPVKMWEPYLQLTGIEQAFKKLKGNLAIRPGQARPPAVRA